MDYTFGEESFNATHFACAMKDFTETLLGLAKGDMNKVQMI